ncbi:MAG: Lytic transglycosylase, catalytic [Myxococcaceae bacterium]|nr:Lytic transglycosylase, catalytic [Myxococcaceae bacterium]
MGSTRQRLGSGQRLALARASALGRRPTRRLALRTWLGASALLCASVLAPARSRADIYEYVDAAGVTHYTNVPQAGKSWRKLQFEGRKSRVIKTPSGQRDRSPDRFSRYDEYLLEAARLYQLPVALLRAVMHIESDFDPNVVSVDGAVGLMQLMPFTAEQMGVSDPFDPRQNILGGTRFLRILANLFQGDLVKTVASYNAGPGAVNRYHGVPPFSETRRYVNRVLERYYAYRAVASE